VVAEEGASSSKKAKTKAVGGGGEGAAPEKAAQNKVVGGGGKRYLVGEGDKGQSR
jgi:hypothetical protein